MRIPFSTLPLFALSSLSLVVGCGSGSGSNEGAGLTRFASEQALSEYLAAQEEAGGGGDLSDAEGAAPSSAAPAEKSSTSNATITNNQEVGVDEGDIVKNVGESLLVLRKGRLYAVSTATSGAPTQTDAIRVAKTDSLNSGVWYDEMLVRGDIAYVIGYRYGVKMSDPNSRTRGSTEVNSFRLAGGKLTRLDTLFLESNDYYSGSNYASRMTGGKLVFYMPTYARDYDYKTPLPSGAKRPFSIHFPKRLAFDDVTSTFSEVGTIFQATDVFRPLASQANNTFHTVVRCDLPEDGTFSCGARAILGNWWRSHYVTGDAVFLQSDEHTYRFRFQDLAVNAHRSTVAPIDQFSFKEQGGTLYLVGNEVSMKASNSGVVNYAQPTGRVILQALPVSEFDAVGAQTLAAKTTELSNIDPKNGSSYAANPRFVGNRAFVSVSSYSKSGTGNSSEQLLSVDLDTKAVQATPWTRGQVSRIEPLGSERALVVSQAYGSNGSGGSLSLDVLETSGALAPKSTFSLGNALEGENRSHAFFFRPDASGTSGSFGLPVVNSGATGGSGWGNGIANIAFFRLETEGKIAASGVISSGNAPSVCETSCIDWYGNTRPVFLGARAFALMGSELTEIAVDATAATPMGARIVLQ